MSNKKPAFYLAGSKDCLSDSFQLPSFSAVGAHEIGVYESARITLPFTLTLTSKSTTFGTEIMVAFDEIAFEVTNFKHLHWPESNP